MLDRFRYDQILLLEGMRRARCLNKTYAHTRHDYPTCAMKEKENKETLFSTKGQRPNMYTIHIDRYKVLHIMLCLLSSPRVLVKVATLTVGEFIKYGELNL